MFGIDAIAASAGHLGHGHTVGLRADLHPEPATVRLSYQAG